MHREAEATYARVREELEKLIASSIGLLAGSGQTLYAFDAAPQALASYVHTDPLPCAPTRQGTDLVLDNGLLRAVVDEQGLVTSVVDLRSGRAVLAEGRPANLLQLHPDLPNAWDAWDVDAFYRNRCTDLTMASEVSVRDGVVVVTRRFGSSVVKQRISLAQGSARLDFETEVDWGEVESILKVAFPLAVHADRCACEIQFGHVMRPTHVNTSWEAAKFEICAHRFVHIAEPGFGVAVVNDSTYGHDVRRDGAVTTVRLSLLRAPRFPDPVTDQGVHRFHYALAPGADIADAVREGYRINLPPRVVFGAAPCEALVRVDNPAVVVEAVKLADDRSGDVIVRLYESLGGRASATLTPSFPVASVSTVDLLERPLSADTGLAMDFGPFQIRTVRLHR